jgi:hypothetical protein
MYYTLVQSCDGTIAFPYVNVAIWNKRCSLDE